MTKYNKKFTILISRLIKFKEVIKINNTSEVSSYDIFLKTMKLHYKCSKKILESKGLYSGQPAMLFILLKQGMQSQRELAKKLNVSPATVNVMVKRLEKSGFVERVKDKDDLRISRVSLTEKGKAIAKEAFYGMNEVSEKVFKNLSPEEEKDLNFLLNKINDGLMEVLDNKN